MERPKFSPYHTLFLLFLFWCMWLYTEVAEYRDRTAHRAEVDAFMHRGDRFTADDGRAMQSRLFELEQEIQEIKEASEK